MGAAEADEVERLLHGHVSMCHNAAMVFMKNQQPRAAGKVLRQCEAFILRETPASVGRIVARKGIMHTVYNNLAQHANMTADMGSSIQFLEKALVVAE